MVRETKVYFCIMQRGGMPRQTMDQLRTNSREKLPISFLEAGQELRQDTEDSFNIYCTAMWILSKLMNLMGSGGTDIINLPNGLSIS